MQRLGSRPRFVSPADAPSPRLHRTVYLVALALIVAISLVVRLWPLNGASSDYQDEGVYWESLRLLASGHPLFSQVFSSQPPFFLYGLFPFYTLLGSTLAAARAGVAVYSLFGLLGVAVLARLTTDSGRGLDAFLAGVGACVLLAADPLYLPASYTLQAEGPALGLSAAGVALAAVAASTVGARRLVLAIAGGAVVGLGIMTKLFDVVALPPAVLYLVAPSFAASGPARRGDRIASAASALVALGLGVAVALAVTAAPALLAHAPLYDQVVRFHLEAEHTYLATNLSANIALIKEAAAAAYSPLYAALALAACILAVVRRAWNVLPPLVWLVGGLAVLARQQPLLGHQLVLIAPPLAVLGGLGLGLAVGVATDGLHKTVFAVSTALVGALLYVVVVLGATEGLATARTATTAAPPTVTALASALQKVTAPGEVVATDYQYVAALAGRPVVPFLVDTSSVRIAVGYNDAHILSTAATEREIEAGHVRVILSANRRFAQLAGFLTWVQQHYRAAATFGPGQVLYVRDTPW